MPNNYLASHKNHFWRWEDHGNVVSIPGGNTIAYTSLINDYLSNLLFQGLPPFGSLLLVVIALNPNGRQDIETLRKLIKDHKNAHGNGQEIEQSINFMISLSNLPKKYKIGKGRMLLMKTIFEECHGIMSFRRSKRVVELFQELPQSVFEYSSFQLRSIEFLKPFRTLALIGRKLRTVDEIITKMESLVEVIDDLELEEPISIDPTDLIDNLIQDGETFHVGSLVKTIWAGVNIPFHSTIPSQQAMGGVSDLTNKGNFDQLLISEFANDDLVFLSRLANNEALYLNRESPPSANNLKRIILIDVSLKNWGTPKILSFSTMLAIAKHPKTNIDCDVYIVGNDYVLIDHNSVDGIINALQIVEASMDASSGLEHFFLAANLKDAEVFIITEKNTQKLNGMFKVINDFKASIHYIIQTDSLGKIDIYKNLSNGKRHIQHLEIPIKRLWEKKSKTIKSKKGTKEFYPILIQKSNQLANILPINNGETFQINKKGFVLRYFDKSSHKRNRGWEIIHENIDFWGEDVEMGWNQHGEYILLLFSRSNRLIQLLNLYTKEKVQIPFHNWSHVNGPNFIFHEGHFYHLNSWNSYKINLAGDVTNISKDDKLYANLKSKFTQRLSQITESKRKFGRSQNVFKNITKVGINDLGELMFNKHKFSLNSNQKIQLNPSITVKWPYWAKQVHHNQFSFEDGSFIEIKPCGLIILTSSDKQIPTIYFPSIIDVDLGIATKQEYAGNPYYYNEPTYEILIHKIGENSLYVKSWLQKITGFYENDINNLLENIPVTIPIHLSKMKISIAKNNLSKWDAEIEIRPIYPDFNRITIIELDSFYYKYVQQFISTIQQYGT